MKLQWLVRILLRHFASAFSPSECRPTRLFGGQNRLIIFSLTNVSGHSLFLHKSPLCSGKIVSSFFDSFCFILNSFQVDVLPSKTILYNVVNSVFQ